MTSEGSKTRIKWEGHSQKKIREWQQEVRQDAGLELHQLEKFEAALDSKAMGKSALASANCAMNIAESGIGFCTLITRDGYTCCTASTRRRIGLHRVT